MQKLNKCVYLHVYENSIVYVGSGNICRAYSKSKRSEEHVKLFDDLEILIIFRNLSEQLAKVLEEKLIALYWHNPLLNKLIKSGKIKSISYDEIYKYFVYDETSSTFIRWKTNPRRSSTFIGKVAGHVSKSGYVEVGLNGVRYYGHRIIATLISQSDLPVWAVIDHVDGNRSNNKADNLRITTQSANARNKHVTVSDTGIYNISENKIKKNFSVGYRVNYKQYRVYFSYSASNPKNNNNWFSSREEALVAAKNYKEKLKLEGIL